MASIVNNIRSWWNNLKGKPNWRPAEEFVDYTQFERNKVEAFLNDLDTFAQDLCNGSCVSIICQDYHMDDQNAEQILSSFFPNGHGGKRLMIESPRKDIEPPHFKIDHHWNNYLQATEREVNSINYGIPSSSSIISALLWQKLVEQDKRKERKKRIPYFEIVGTLGLYGNFFDKLEPECALGSIVTAQLVESGSAEFVNWPLKGWGSSASHGITDFIHHCDPSHYSELRKGFESTFGSLNIPAKMIGERQRNRVLETLVEIAESRSKIPIFDMGHLEKMGVVVGEKEIHEYSKYFKSTNDILAIQNAFWKLEKTPRKRVELRKPYCRLKVSNHYNVIDFQKRLILENFNLGFKRFNRIIENRRISKWYLPLIILQPIERDNSITNIVYCMCHPIYRGVPDFSVGKMMVDLADRIQSVNAGGSELIGSIYFKNPSAYDVFSRFSEQLLKAVPKEFQYGRIPVDVQKRALKLVKNTELYKDFA
jgi:hypothetical protein